jgi:hypothetical protein
MTAWALGADVTGTYAGQTPSGPASVDLQCSGTVVHGVIHDQNGDHPLVAQLSGDQVVGTIDFQGQQAGFNAVITDQGMIVAPRSNRPFQLARSSAAAEQPEQVQPLGHRPDVIPSAQPNAAQPAPLNAQIVQGQNYDFPLPSGWRVQEANNALFLSSADGLTRVSECVDVWNAPGTPAPDALALLIMKNAGLSGIQVISSQAVQVPSGRAVMMEVSFQGQGTSFRGVAYSQIQDNKMCRLIVVQAPPQTFAQVRNSLTQIATNIQLTRPGAMGTARSAIAAIDPMLGANAMYRSGQAQLHNEDASWRYQQDSLAERSLQQEDTTMGYSRFDQHPDGTWTPHNYDRSRPYPAAGQ